MRESMQSESTYLGSPLCGKKCYYDADRNLFVLVKGFARQEVVITDLSKFTGLCLHYWGNYMGGRYGIAAYNIVPTPPYCVHPVIQREVTILSPARSEKKALEFIRRLGREAGMLVDAR